MRVDWVAMGTFAFLYSAVGLAIAVALVWVLVLAIKFLRLRIAELKRSEALHGDDGTRPPGP